MSSPFSVERARDVSEPSAPPAFSVVAAVARSPRWWTTAALGLWLATFAAVQFRMLAFSGTGRSVYPVFASAGDHWNRGEPLYQSKQYLYRYSPAVAAMFGPLATMPNRLGEIIWRDVNFVVIGIGLLLFARRLPDGPFANESPSARAPAALSFRAARNGLLLLVWPMSIASVWNGQANPLMLGLMLVAYDASLRRRWNTAAAAIAAATVLKVYPVVFGALLALIFPRQLAWRLAAALSLAFLLPFALRDPAYVAGQYSEWFAFLAHDTRTDWEWVSANRDAWLLIRRLGLPISFAWYQCGGAMAGLGIAAAVCWMLRTATDEASQRSRAARFALHAGCGWMLVFGPATESCTYILLAPWFAEVWLARIGGRIDRTGALLITAGAVLLIGAEAANLFPWAAQAHSYGLQPVGALFLLTALVRQSIFPGLSPSGRVHFLRQTRANAQSMDGPSRWAKGWAG